MQLEYSEDDWGALSRSYQAHTGAVNTGSSPHVEYGYEAAGSGSQKRLRLNQLSYPNGRAIYYNHGALGGKSDRLNRVDNVATVASTSPTDAQMYAQYKYLGAGTVVEMTYTAITSQPELTRLKAGGTNDPYHTFDRFGRVIDQWWKDSSDDLDRFTYGYDNSSNRTWRQNEMTHSDTTKSFDEAYSYDGLDRLTAMKRGRLDGSHAMPANPLREKLYALDQVGNWATLTEKANGSDTLVQLRKHNQVNEIDNDNDHTNAVGTGNDYPLRATTGNNWIAPRYDAAGNMTSGPKPSVGSGPATEETTRQHYSYDAWNRLVKARSDSGGNPDATVAEYQYDGLHRRTANLVPHEDNTSNWDRTDYYYNEDWQCLEEKFSPDAGHDYIGAAKVQYVWDLRYIDSVICRDRDATGDSALEERLYYTADANFNVTGLINAANGYIVERYTYDDYGKVTFRQADWSVAGSDGTASAYGNEILYCGYRFDKKTNHYQARHRPYQPTLGRWTSRDPALYEYGLNLLEYCGGRPPSRTDPSGMGDPRHWSSDTVSDPMQQYQQSIARTPRELNDEAERDVIKATTIEIKHWKGSPCCKEDYDKAISMANKALSGGECKKWFTDRGARGRRTFYLTFHPAWRPMCWGGYFPMWTHPNIISMKVIRVCPVACDYGAAGMASMMIHEAAHHLCPPSLLLGGEQCAESAQEACR